MPRRTHPTGRTISRTHERLAHDITSDSDVTPDIAIGALFHKNHRGGRHTARVCVGEFLRSGGELPLPNIEVAEIGPESQTITGPQNSEIIDEELAA